MSYYRRVKDLGEDSDYTQKFVSDYLGMKQPQYSDFLCGILLFFDINLFDCAAEGIAHKYQGVLFKILCIVADEILSFAYF